MNEPLYVLSENCDNQHGDPAIPQSKLSKNILLSKGLLDAEKEQPMISSEDLQKWNANVAEEQEKWDAINEVNNEGDQVPNFDNISYEEVFQYFKNFHFVNTSSPQSPNFSIFAKFLQMLFGPVALRKQLRKERELIFHISNVSMDNSNTVHCRTLQTIYKKLTQSKRNHPRFGSHWEDVGFQGKDPATDLRGVGFLGLLHLLFLVTEHKELALDMYKLSLDPVHNFPLCLISINMTKIALQLLQEDRLSYSCNTRRDVVGVVNDFYIAIFLHLYIIWKNGNKTMLDSGHVIDEVEKYATHHPKTLLKSLQENMKKYKQNLPSPINSSKFSNAITASNKSNYGINQTNQEVSNDGFQGVVELVMDN